MSGTEPGGPTFAGAIVAFVIGTILLLAIGEAATRIFYPRWAEYYSGHFMQLEKRPGHRNFWIGKPGFDGYFAQNNGDFRHAIRINAAGLRNDEPASAANDRVWMLGDSMTFGWGVERAETFTAKTQLLSGFKTYNVAGPGNDVCAYQALADRMSDAARPRAVVVGLIVENDVQVYDCREQARQHAANNNASDESSVRSLAAIKYALTGYSALYNVVATSIKRVPWLLEGLTGLGLVSRQHQTRNVFDASELSARSRTTAGEVARLREFLPRDTQFAVVVVPARFELRDEHGLFKSARLGVIRALREKGVAVIDLYDRFRKAGFAQTHFVHDGHWSAKGHLVAARAISDWLKTNIGPAGPNRQQPNQTGLSSPP